MLVTFKTEAYANITMFGEVAVTLLKLMGHSGTVPGALMAEDVPAALERLKAAVTEHPQTPLDPTTAGGREGRGRAAPREPGPPRPAPDPTPHGRVGCQGACPVGVSLNASVRVTPAQDGAT